METADVIIVGGGIWGLSTAYHLSRDSSAKIVLLERNASLANETTKQSAGQVGQLRGDPLLARGVGYTLELLGSFAEVTGHDPKFVRSGSLHLSLVPQRTTMLREVAKQAESCGVASRFIDEGEMADMAPNFRFEKVDAGLHVPNDGYVDAPACALAYGRAAMDQGVDVRLGSTVREIKQSASTFRVSSATQGAFCEFEAKHVVVCGGPWTSRLLHPVGVYPPMHPIRLQQARSAACEIPATHPVVRVPDESCYIRPEKGGFLYGFFDPSPHPIDVFDKPAEFATVDVQPESQLVTESQQRLKPVLPLLSELAVDEYRQGMMTCTPDGKFVIGPADKYDAGGATLWMATGCGGTGIAGSGAVGRWLSEWILDGETSEDISQYAPNRFGEKSRDQNWLCAQACETSAAYYRLK